MSEPNMLAGAIGEWAGLRIVESDLLYDVEEDWSQVRSPGRARRRRWKHPQRIAIRHVPKPDAYRIGNAFHMHPETARRFREMARIAKWSVSP